MSVSRVRFKIVFRPVSKQTPKPTLFTEWLANHNDRSANRHLREKNMTRVKLKTCHQNTESARRGKGEPTSICCSEEGARGGAEGTWIGGNKIDERRSLELPTYLNRAALVDVSLLYPLYPKSRRLQLRLFQRLDTYILRKSLNLRY